MRVAFIWHMHQPFYKNLRSGEYLMPWVRLHGAKDYLDMLLILDEFPEIRQTFNLVPALLDQIRDYTDNGAVDRHLFLSRKPSGELRDNERKEMCESFFSAHFETMIKPYPRYLELYNRCRRNSASAASANMSGQDIIDLQFWANAAWIDPMFREQQWVKALFSKGRNFTEEEKNSILGYQIGLMKRLIPEYKKRLNDGRIEISFSPYYHPILPLLIDTDIARQAVPGMHLPSRRFAHPEDADEQIARSVKLHRELFGRELKGMWPSEGSVSEAILPLVHKHGIRWIASDEEVYFASVAMMKQSGDSSAGALDGFHRAFEVGPSEHSVGMLFRDHKMSDKIGFVYSGWDPDRAAEDFVSSLKQIGKYYANSGEEPLIPIILDGENAWEYYKNDGRDFLTALYSRLSRESNIKTVLPGEIFADGAPVKRLPRLFAGSWINHNFRVWIGHSEDNAAWDLLKQTRDKLVEVQKSGTIQGERIFRLAWEAIYIAEGSDWCWWFGDDHHTDHFQTFDLLFRLHLIRVWELLGLEPPQALNMPIRKAPRLPGILEPTDYLRPTIDGRQTSFFEWFGAGRIECTKLGGAMHRADFKMHEIMYGYNDDKIFFRVDFEKEKAFSENEAIHIELVCADKMSARIDRQAAALLATDNLTPVEGIQAMWESVAEIAIDRKALRFTDDKRLYFAVSLTDRQKTVERWPDASYISLELPEPGISEFWQV